MNMKSSVVLLNLLRIALGNSVEWKGEGSVDWKKVIGLARKQGVLAIAFDALEKVPTELRPSKNILLEWFGRVNTMELVYELYVNTIKDLGRLIGWLRWCSRAVRCRDCIAGPGIGLPFG